MKENSETGQTNDRVVTVQDMKQVQNEHSKAFKRSCQINKT